MATYVLFWNPEISSYTKERFLNDFINHECVGNWSFYEHDDVKNGDFFYMVACGNGPVGIVMRGIIVSECYESEDWSPKKRRHIYYADIEQGVCVNPWSEAPLLTPEVLTQEIPDFNWFGGHSGRKLDEVTANKLDDVWFRYLDSNPAMVADNNAWIDYYNGTLMPERVMHNLILQNGSKCEICGYDYVEIFGEKEPSDMVPTVSPQYIIAPSLKRLFYNLCYNCDRAPVSLQTQKLKDK